MSYDSKGYWYVVLAPFDTKGPINYSYFVTENGHITRREWHGHHRDAIEPNAIIIDWWKEKPDAPLYSETFTKIVGADKVDHWRGAGVAIPVFSLRSHNSFGIGEFTDIPLLVDWAEKTGMCIIQLLPINDTTMTHTWIDSYPYNANSAFALHPAYIHLEMVGKLSDKTIRRRFQRRQQVLNSLPHVDYEKVTTYKWEYLRLIYLETGAQTLASNSFQSFLETNSYWLRPYAVFCYLRDTFGTADFNQWKGITYSNELIERLAPTLSSLTHMDIAKAFNTPNGPVSEASPECLATVAFHYFIQYHLHIQLQQAVEYAHAHGVTLKGDIPIGINRTSVDTWVYPQLFHMNGQAGAPPDAFAVDGQNWGFPTYDWEEMAKDGYRWFRTRFKKISDYFDAYRIDHLLGFFRIWEIPTRYRSGLLGHFSPALPYSEDEICERLGIGRQQLITLSTLAPEFNGETTRHETDVLFLDDTYRNGYFHPRIFGYDAPCFQRLNEWQKNAFRALHEEFFFHRHNDFWRKEAMKKLPVLMDSTDMLVCGEDLGMIPSCVSSVMNELNILSLEIQQMPKDTDAIFGDPARYPYHSVCTTSSHDMANIRAWWEENPELTTTYWRTMLHRTDEMPPHCEPSICEAIIRIHMTSPSMLAILPLQDWLSIDEELRYPDPIAERINIPANPRHYWRYRMHLYLEDLLAEEAFNQKVKALTHRMN